MTLLSRLPYTLQVSNNKKEKREDSLFQETKAEKFPNQMRKKGYTTEEAEITPTRLYP
jgi:hypothetical protein